MPQIIKGSFISTGVATPLNLPIDPDFVEVYIQGDATGSNWNSIANPAVTKYAKWFKGMTNGSAFTTINTAGAATDAASFIVANGFTYYDGSVQTPGAPVTGTIISQAAAAVCTINGHGLVTGDRVVLSNCTGMEQVEGMTFTVTYLTANTFSIPINTSAFAAPATAVTARRLPALPLFAPRAVQVTGISQASPMVISVAENHGFTAGAIIRLEVPSDFGMPQANGQLYTVTAVGATTLTIGAVDSTGFTAFAFPAAAGIPFTFAQVVPVGEIATTLTNTVGNTGFRGLILGTSVCGPNAARVYYTATKADAVV